MSYPVLLDTCTAIWLMNGDQMSQQSRDAIGRGQKHGVYVSPITAWEIGILAATGRLQLTLSPDAWFDELLSLPGVRLADLPPKVMIDSSFLPGTAPQDPADRILAATARFYGYSIITRDRALLEYGREGHAKVIAC